MNVFRIIFIIGILLFIKAEKTKWRPAYGYPQPTPQEIMVDSVNYIGLVLLHAHSQNNENNIALSPYGATSVLVALSEGVEGRALDEILRATLLPLGVDVTRVGLRDIHRHLKSYFIPEEGFLAGLTFSHNNVTLKASYQNILNFYGYDVDNFNYPLYPDPATTTSTNVTPTASPINVNNITVPSTITTIETTTNKPQTLRTTKTTALSSRTETMTITEVDTTLTSKTSTSRTTVSTPGTQHTATVPTSTFANTETTMFPTPDATTQKETITKTPPSTTQIPEPSTPMLTSTMQPITTTNTPTTISTTTKVTTQPSTTTIPPSTTTLPSTTTITTTKVTTQPSTTTLQLSTSTATTLPSTSIPTTTQVTTQPSTTTIPPSTTTLPSTSTPTTTQVTTQPSTTTIPPSTTTATILPSTSTPITTQVTTQPSTTTIPPSTTTATTLPSTSTPITTEVTTQPSSTTLQPSTTISTTQPTTTTNMPSTTIPIITTTETTTTNKPTTSATATTLPISTNKVFTTTLGMSSTTTRQPTTTTLETTTTLISATPLTGETTTSTMDLMTEAATFTTILDSTPTTITTVPTNTPTTLFMSTSTLTTTTELNSRGARSVADYLIAQYRDSSAPSHIVTRYEPTNPTSFLVNGKVRESNINFMTYDTVLPFRYISYLNALALTFPLDSTQYYLLLLLPVDETGIESLIDNLMSTTLKQIIYNLQPTRVKATIPSFMLKGYVILTSTLQKLGIKSIFEPRHADFSKMTDDKNIYVTNIEQAITVNIRNYVDPTTLHNQDIYQRRGPVVFNADHPFLYFVMDSQIHVALMAGKITNPLNSRIR